MVKYGRLPGKKQSVEITENPYDLVDLVVNNLPVKARPFVFSGDMVDSVAMTDASGALVRPVRCVAQCPECGDCLEVDLAVGGSRPVVIKCTSVIACRFHRSEPVFDPFFNPVAEGLLVLSESEVDVITPSNLPQIPEATTVAKRLRRPKPAGGFSNVTDLEDAP